MSIVLAGAAGAACALECPERLRVGSSDTPFPPMINGRGPQPADPPGWAIVAVREAAHRLGCMAEIQRLPGRRMSLLLEQGGLEFAFFFGATPERLKAFRFPLDVMGQPDAALAPVIGHLAFYVLPGAPPPRGTGWNGAALAPGLRVGVVDGTTQEQVARGRGWRVETASNFLNALEMLRAGRFELLLATRESLTADMRDAGLVELAPVVQYQPYFVPASARLWARRADFVRAFWRETCAAVRRAVPDARPVDCGVAPPAPRHP